MQWPPSLSSFKTFSSLHNNILYPLSSHFPFSLTPIIWQALICFCFVLFCFVSMDLPIISYKRNHKICDLLCLPFFHLACFWHSSKLWYGSVLCYLCGWIIFHYMDIPQLINPFIHWCALFLSLAVMNDDVI